MGFLGKLFGGGGPKYPALEATTPGADKFEKYRSQIEPLIQKISDKFEAIPGESVIYVFMGDPRGMFGFVWFKDGNENNFKTLMKAKGLSQKQMQHLSVKLQEAYEKSLEAPRYSTKVANKDITVTFSDSLASQIHNILQEYGA